MSISTTVRAGRFVLFEGGLTILSLGCDRQVALQLQQRAQAFAHQALVIDDRQRIETRDALHRPIKPQMQPGGDWAHNLRAHAATWLRCSSGLRLNGHRNFGRRLGRRAVRPLAPLEDRQDDGAQAGHDDQELEDAAGNRHGAEQPQDEQANQQRCVDLRFHSGRMRLRIQRPPR